MAPDMATKEAQGEASMDSSSSTRNRGAPIHSDQWTSQDTSEPGVQIKKKVRPNTCPERGKALSSKRSLQRHLLRSTHPNRHVCLLCGKKFISQAHLQRHRRTHAGASRYTSVYCGEKFSRKMDFAIHALRPAGEKPCPWCPAEFSHNISLKAHKAILHDMP
ncbi:uncharacterized protein [Dermacentor andersoni]|uniref:uncharacterized protein isoform X2 n=1 Tax=Dermacentor andersoni TaxID=34620 RepID=UPI003B3B12C0